ncbi:MAG: IS3 family transposase, partial [Betaproteobacteria bacterium]|nr:IS3 family transposase [Betaproteobacteria bacterium]
FIDEHRHRFGVEPICRVLRVAPSSYRHHAARLRSPELRSDRAKQDEVFKLEIDRLWRANREVYGQSCSSA